MPQVRIQKEIIIPGGGYPFVQEILCKSRTRWNGQKVGNPEWIVVAARSKILESLWSETQRSPSPLWKWQLFRFGVSWLQTSGNAGTPLVCTTLLCGHLLLHFTNLTSSRPGCSPVLGTSRLRRKSRLFRVCPAWSTRPRRVVTPASVAGLCSRTPWNTLQPADTHGSQKSQVFSSRFSTENKLFFRTKICCHSHPLQFKWVHDSSYRHLPLDTDVDNPNSQIISKTTS